MVAAAGSKKRRPTLRFNRACSRRKEGASEQRSPAAGSGTPPPSHSCAEQAVTMNDYLAFGPHKRAATRRAEPLVPDHQKDGILFGWVFSLVPSAHLRVRCAPTWAPSTCRRAGEIEQTPIGAQLSGSRRDVQVADVVVGGDGV